jgi:hypothetical protein
MEPTKIYMLRVAFALVALVVGWWMTFRPDKVNQYFGNPVFSRTPWMASFNRTHSILFGIVLMIFGIIIGAQNAIIIFHHL